MRSPRSRVVLALGALVAATLAACSSGGQSSSSAPPASPTSAAPSSSAPTSARSSTTATATVALPTSPAGLQTAWLIAAAAHPPISDADARAHFDATFLQEVSPARLNQVLGQATAITVLSITANQPDALVVIVSTGAGAAPIQVSLHVDAQGLISGLLLTPALPPVPATWAGVDAALHAAAPQVHLLVADVTTGSCQPLHSIDPTTPAPLGSAFKLYVLDALATAVASGHVSWHQALTITAQLKSLPSGQLQTEPDGTQVTVQHAAANMISISDNTGADLLINLLGRPAVEAALTATHMADPARDEPFLTTRELFGLKLDQWPTLAARYIAADEAGRRALLAQTVDPAPLPGGPAWTTPRDIDTIEWFASADDICRAYLALGALAQRPGLSPVADVLQINDGGLGLDPAQWRSTWFKGGSEPGVLTLTYRATTTTGRIYVVVMLTENPAVPIGTASADGLLSAVKGAFTLAAAG